MPNGTEDKWQQAGWTTYAAIMLFGGGLVGIVNGIWALRYDDNEDEAKLVWAERTLEAWGVGSLLGGILILLTGIGVFNGKPWARWTGIALSVLALAWAAGWAEIQPTQSLIAAIIHITVIFGLATNPVAAPTDQ